MTTYDSTYGLITGVTITGADGSRSQITNGLSTDHKTIHTATTASAAPGQPLSARSTTTYEYDGQGHPPSGPWSGRRGRSRPTTAAARTP